MPRHLQTLAVCLTLLLGLIGPSLVGWANTPPKLPEAVVAKVPANQAVMLDFYADWCGWCQRMAPTVKHITKTSKGKLLVLPLNIDNPKNKALVAQFNVTSVPTYFIYNPRHQLVFTMNEGLDTAVLKTVAQQQAHQLVKAPVGLLGALGSKPLHWVQVAPGQTQQAATQALLYPGKIQVHLLPFNANTMAWLQAAGAKPLAGSTVLLDGQGQVLYRSVANTPAATLTSYLNLFAMGQPG
jgi:thioredoxin 1